MAARLLGLPSGSDVGFVTGATMANFTGLAAGAAPCSQRAGWDVERDGLNGAPRVHVWSAPSGTTRSTSRCATSGSAADARSPPTSRAASASTRSTAGARRGSRPASSSACRPATCTPGAFDPFARAIEVAHGHGAWVHVDGAFGLWAAAVAEPTPPRRRASRAPTRGRPTRTRR